MQLKTKDIKGYREQQLANQNGICPLCLVKIEHDKSHLDHDHSTGHIRQVLCNKCNLLEGMMLYRYRRSGVSLDYKLWLGQLLNYLDQDYSQNPLHPTHKSVEEKQFKSLSKAEQESKLRALGIEPTGTKANLVKLYRNR